MLIAGATVWYFRPANLYGPGIAITNYDQYLKDLPTDRRQAINAVLLSMANYNSTKPVSTANTAAIRQGSVAAKYNQITNVHSGTFIADIPALKQSYVIQYEWSSDSNNISLSDRTVVASCPKTEQTIYKSTTCKEMPEFNGEGEQ